MRSTNLVAGPLLGIMLMAHPKEIIKMHRGAVSVLDNPGGGSVFTLSFGDQFD